GSRGSCRSSTDPGAGCPCRAEASAGAAPGWARTEGGAQRSPAPRGGRAGRAAGRGHKPAPAAPAPPVELKPRFQDGMKYAYVNVQAVAAASVEGRVAAEKIKVLQEQKSRELQEKNKALQSAQQKLDQGGSV